MMCSLVCSSQGRHVHVGYCRAGVDGTCDDAEVQHLTGRVFPNPDRPKDCITHGLYWRRTGASCFQFRAYPFHDASQASKVIFSRSICKSVHRYRYLDPYTRDEQTNFAKWYVRVYIFTFDVDADSKLRFSDAMCPGM